MWRAGGYRRLGSVQALCRASKAAQPDNPKENLQISYVYHDAAPLLPIISHIIRLKPGKMVWVIGIPDHDRKRHRTQ